MAYNYFPQSYQPYINPYQQNFQQQFPQQTQQNTQPQIQNSGFVSVRNIEEAFNWPVAPGNSITFKDENSPYIYTKTKGFSQLEAPIFERFRLVKEEDSQAQETSKNSPKASEKDCKCDGQIKLLWDEVNALKSQIEAMKPKPKKTAKKEAEIDEQSTSDAE